MKLKEIRFYLDGDTHMAEVKHEVNGEIETINSPTAFLGKIDGMTLELAKAIVEKVKKNVQCH